LREATATSNEKASATVTIIDLLRFRAATQPNQIAYRFLADGEEERASLTYGELDRRARQIAAELQTISAVGQRALLLDSSELDFIIAFFGCLCAGVTAVPIYAPRLNKKGNARVESVVADAQPSVVLTAGSGSPAIRDLVTASVGEHVKWIDTNALPNRGDLWIPSALSGTDTAFLQYTSGSTANPKGVMVSHANILHNEEMIQKAFGTGPGSTIVGWLPLYHDMGLIGTVLQPLFAGVPCILMSPVAFLQRPLRWLQAIARYQATTSGGPNFAYELCMRKIRPEDRSGLDLSSWRVAFNGAEPVRLETLNRFAAQFADCGFRREAFVPCYGLAEGTLFVSGGLEPNGVTAVHHGANGGPTNGAKTSRQGEKMLVACGRPPAKQEVRILSPDSLQPCFNGQVGEIWIKGPSVAQGYWRKPKETEETFNAQIPGTAEGPFLRTGDLGFLSNGHLFITGRLKDLLIIRGQNYYPQDIELTVEQSHPVLQPGSGAAFSVEIEGEERLVVVQEVAVTKGQETAICKDRDNDNLDALIKLISRNIVAQHEQQPYGVVLIRKGTIPKTSSGKIQRHACKDAFLRKDLAVLREWPERESPEATSQGSTSGKRQRPTLSELAPWLVAEIARIKGIDQERVDLQQPFTAYGLDSLDAIEFAHKLHTEFEVEVEVSEFFADSAIADVVQRATGTLQTRVSRRATGRPASYPLSYGQRALWFVHQTAPDSAGYNLSRVIRIATNLDVDALRLAFQALVDRHPCLRTIVVETAGEPVQQVAEKAEVSFEYFDARDWSQVELEKGLVQQSQRPFSLTLGPLFRTVLYARSEKEYLLHVAVHHMVADYWSLTLLLDEIGKLYQAYANKVETHLVPLEYSYADFVEWQREKLSGPAGERLRDYWKNELAGELPPLSLPADHIRPPVQTFRGASFPFSLDARLTEALKRLGEEQQATLFTTLLAAFQVLLYRLTSQKQVIVGCPIAGRSRAEFANTAGYFVNAVPLRADFQQRQTFTEFLSQVRNRVSKAFAHELYPFSLMVEQLGITRDPAVPPIFQSAFAFQQTYGSRSEDFVRFALGQPQAQVTLGGLQLEHVVVEQQTAQFDLTLTVGEGPDGIVGAWEYSSDLFDHSTVVRWSENFKVLLQAVAQHPDCHVSRFAMLSTEQRRQIVEEFNHTQLNYDCQQCVHDEISRQAMSTPDRIAVAFGAIELSYQQLEQRSNQVAHYLRKLGVGPDVRVGVCLDRSVELVVFLLGVLKAGGAYIPLDPGYPAERLQYMAQDAQAPVVIVQKRQIEQFANLGVRLICAEDQQAEIERERVADVGVGLEDENLAYVIYTSGSTGKPKGAMNTHRGLQNRLQWMQEKYQLTSDDRVLQKTPFSFDVSVWEFFWPLMVGARLVMAEPGRHQDPEYLGQTIEQQGVTTLHFVPSMLQAFLESGEAKRCGKLRRIICSGEALSAELARKCVEQIPAELHNLYGPTEAAIDVTYWPCRREDLAGGVAIGKPIANTQMYVLDAEYEPVPVGVEGEIYIAGVGLARGYWNRPDLTAGRFIANPLSAEGGARMYRTGDRGRWRRDGNLEYLGRFDHQVKLRGFRIELGEIEACLAKFEGVKETVVEVRGATAGDKRLVAYIVPDEVQARPLRKMARLKKAGDLTESKLYELPNGMLVKFQNKSETDFLYREIFEGEGYLRHGITLEANACVFDIGANIGMFSLFVAQLAPAATVYAFEPIPAVFDDLRINMELYVGNPRAFNCGLAGGSGTVTFTWYRHDSVLSGRYADLKEESSTVKSFLKSQSESKDLSDEDLDRLLAERLSGERVECQLRTLSSVIAEEKIEQIDLLKIDVEKSELDVLEGIEDHDWEKIRQIVLEVHDSDGRLGVVKRMLKAHGYELHIEQDELLQTTNLYNIYARQTKNVPRAEGAGISPHPVRAPTYFSPAQFIASLKNHLKTLLPEYMVPAAYVCLDRLPLTPNGKLDRKALPAPEADAYAAHVYEAPQGTMETTVAGIWAEMLKIERAGRNDNFYDLGGHSLLATQVMSRIRQVFGVEVPLRSFLENPTVTGLALQVDRAAKTAAPPLRPLPRGQRLQLSFAQERLWFLSRYETEASLYNVPVALRLRGAVNIEAVKASLREIVTRHEVLRTSFPEADDRTIQSIAPEIDLAIPVVEAGEDELPQVLRQQARQAFDLSHGPLIRASLFRIGSHEHVLLVVLHHIVSDGWSLGIILREFNVLYDAFSRGAASPLQPLPIQYADFSEWQREWLQGEVLERQLAYWKQQLSGLEALALPTDRPYPAKPTLAGAVEMSCLPQPLVAKLKSLSDQQGVTLFMTLLAGFKILLFRYTGCTDISVGSPIANRNRQELEPLIGFFVNTLVLRTAFAEDASVSRLLQQIREVSLQAYAHQDIPFERLVEALHPARELSRTPLFQVMFVLQNAPLPKVSWNGLEANASVLETGTAKFDLTLSAREEEGELELSLEYRIELFDAARMKRMLQHYRTLLEQIVASVDSRINEIEILSEAEKQQLLVEWNRTGAEYEQEKCLAELFEEQVRKTPEAVAIVSADEQLTYAELNRRANQLGHYLRRLGVAPEVRVGICVERGWEMVVGLLAILKAGGVYVPLDGSYPEERLRYTLEDAKAVVVVAQKALSEKLNGFAGQTVLLDVESEEIGRESREDLQRTTTPENLAYVIYTSGSTGKPKGVAITHGSAVVFLHWAREAFAAEDLGGVLASTSICFDLSVFEIFGPLSCGGTAFVVTNALELASMTEARKVKLVNTVPSAMRELVRINALPESVRIVNLAGEALTWGLVDDVYKAGNVERVCNLYGPSEDTTYSTYAWLEKTPSKTAVPIGKPIANTQIYVLDKWMAPLPIGVVGELYLGGAGLARGYLDRPELTAEKFVPNPFSAIGGARLYRTGDLACYREDGNLDFQGRVDHQVKVRGYRIELTEIDAALEETAGVKQAVSLALDNAGEKRLVAYVVTEAGTTAAQLKAALRKRLPEFMVPSDFVLLDEFPLTPNGKIDRRALATLNVHRGEGASHVEPRTPVEELVAQIWSELLAIERVGAEDNFFALGGHSLLATRMLSRLREVFDREIELRAVFEFPVLADLSAHMAGLTTQIQPDTTQPIVHRTGLEALPLSSQQERLWFLDRYSSSGVAYSLPAAVRLKGDLNKEAMRLSFQEIVRRHEILRAKFVQVGAKPELVICENARFELHELDLRDPISGVAAEQRVNRELTEEATRPFVLAEGELFRVRFLRIGEQEHILLVTIHHIVFDGWSVGVVVNELSALYETYSKGKPSPLADLEIQYSDYAAWQREMLEIGRLTEGLEYWKEQLNGISVLELPTDHARPAVQSFRGANEEWNLPAEIMPGLKQLSREHGVTLFMTLLAGFQILLARYSRQEDIAVGSFIANRAHPQLPALIGFFVNTIVLRTDLSGNPSVDEVLRRTREMCLGVYAHATVPLEKLVDDLERHRDASHNPLFQVAIVLQNTPVGAMQLPGVEITMLPSAPTGSKFDLALIIEEDRHGLHGLVEYSTDLFERETISQMLRHYNQVLQGMVRDSKQCVSTLPLLAPEERRQLLYHRNETAAVVPSRCIHELFEEQAARTPQAHAAQYRGQLLTYGELSQRSNQLAKYLAKVGVAPEVPVATCVGRSLDMLVALLGVLKAGGAYVPLDPRAPSDWFDLFSRDVKPQVLLTQRALLSQVPQYAGTVVVLDDEWDEISRHSCENVRRAASENLACVICTSEPDGTPRGVAIQHSSTVEMLHWAQTTFSEEDLSGVLASTLVDVRESLFEIFAPLCSGGTVFIVEDPFDLADVADSGKVKLIQMPPSALRELVRMKALPQSVRTINLCREAASAGLAHKFYEGTRVERVFNCCGQAEYAGYCTQVLLPRCREDGAVLLGKPVMNTQTYVLDQEMEPVPVGVAGELYLSGAGLARGYVNKADLTASRFIPNPFSAAGGDRLYRTGDMVRYRADGTLDLLGRLDRQIRIRGRRIELGEIEAVLQQQVDVDDAVVTVQATDGRLVAHIIPVATVERGEAWEQKWRESLRAELKRTLPEYMVPSELVLLEKIPLCADGTLDRQALPIVEPMAESSDQAKLPYGETETIIAAIWKKVLKIEEVGVEDNFFDVGGNSLIIPEVHGALQSAFGITLQIVELLQYPTIRSLAKRLEAEKAGPELGEPAQSYKTLEAEKPRSGATGFAIVGMAARFPGANNIEEFWHNLQAGVESIIDFSDEELRAAGIAEELLSSPNYIKRGSILTNADLFDNRFFDISAREAELIDPQQRIFLECAWEALENAGYTPKSYPGKIGLYAGSGASTYFLNLLKGDNPLYSKESAPVLFANASDFLATRVSYKLDLTGPSVTLQTACSTSLVAVHMACRSLMNHECDIAMAGGITVRSPQNIGDIFQEGGIVSPDGHCRTFDERAQGTVKGNGAGIVVIKRLEEALADGDHIRAVIKGSAINNDGGNKVGFTAPSITGQSDVIRQALLESSVSPETITYLEAHGTATSLGDPVEVSALSQAYRAGTEKNTYCAIGSVKSNIGHADAAAGVAGLIKTVLALEHKLIPPTLHFERPNPKIDFLHSPFYVNTKLAEWKRENGPRRAGVSSFGIGGTNAHVILEEAPSDDSISTCRPWQLILLSAKTATALEAAADNLGAYLVANDSVSLPDVAHTLQVGRASFNHRSFVVAEINADAAATLKDRQVRSLAASVVSRAGWPVAFLFPGQGSQYVNMGKQLYAHEPLFRELVDECSELLQPNLQLDLRSVLYPTLEKHEWAEAELRETRTTQPALFVVEYALARMWMSWGLLPERMLGHSVGEYVAACLAGVLSLEDALNLVTVRCRLMQSCARGGMLAIAASEKEVQRYLKMGLDLAAINGSASCVLSGPFDALELAEKELARQQVAHRRLQSSHAFHSAMMDPIIEQFVGEVEKVRLNAPRMRYLSNLTGEWITEEQVTDPEYWGKQLRGTVQFAKGIRNLCDGSDRLTLEVGPGHTNTTAIRQTLPKPALPLMLTTLPDSQTEESDVKHVLTVLGHLWLHGASVDWNAFASGEKRRRLPLPTYPFERQRFWVEAAGSRPSHPDTSRKKLDDWLYLPCWKETARISSGSKADVSESATVLIFGGNSQFEEKLALKLGRKCYDVVTVVAGEEFTRVDHQTYAIRPTARADYDALFTVLGEQGQLPEKILHLWNIGHSDSVEQDVDIALYSPLHLVQAATAEQGMGPIQCVVVSSGLHEITGHEDLSPGKATLLGLCKTIACELPHFACKSVDIEVPAENSRTEDSLVDQLVAELESKEQQPVVSYRGVRRWIQTFDQVHLEADGTELVREGGVYLITGGLNDIGFQFAEWLATEARASIVLLDQRSFPRREHWDIWPETHTGDPAVKQISRIRAWEQGGAKVLISSADVANQVQMNELRNQVQGVWGKVNGVIHAAGFSKRGPLASKTRNDVATILMPKIQGALVLEEVFGGEDLDFMVFCSSLISVIGEREQADYAAANAFLDSLARRNFLVSPYFTMSINWDTWVEADRDVSSAASGAVCGAIRPDEAVEVLRRLLRTRPGPQAIISTRDLAATRPKKVDTAEEETAAVGHSYARPNLDRPIEPPTNPTETMLIRIWTEVLGVSPIGIRDDFFELGGDSLIGLRMTARAEDFGVHLSVDQLFRHPTVQELATAVEQLERTDKIPAIARVPRDQPIPLSYTQQRVWFIDRLAPGRSAYNIPASVRILGPLDLKVLEQVLQEIVSRHESLRTRIEVVDGEPRQIIESTMALPLPIVDLNSQPEEEREAAARKRASEEVQKPFDLQRGPLVRACLLKLDEQDHVLVVTMHHVVSDGWSLGILVGEVSALYKAFSEGESSPLAELPIQYADYSVWQRQWISGDLLGQQLDYWKKELAELSVLDLPTDHPRPSLQSQRGDTIEFTVSADLTLKLKQLCLQQETTLFMMLLAALQTLMSRYSRQHGIATGSGIAGRRRTETENMIGFFVNTLVLRTDLSGEPSFTTLLQRVKKSTLEAYNHQDVPFEKLVEVLTPERDLSRSPLVQVMFTLQNAPYSTLELGPAKLQRFDVHTVAALCDLTVYMAEMSGGMLCSMEYSTDLFEAATITRWIEQFKTLMGSIVADPEQSIAALPLLTATERQQMLDEWNRTETNYPLESSLTDLIEEQAQQTPNAVAVTSEEGRLTYSELNAQANQIARYLRRLGVGPETPVGMCMERSLEMVKGLLGILKAGGVYMPLDPAYPMERLLYMVADSKAPVTLTQERLVKELPPHSGRLVKLDAEWSKISEEDRDDLHVRVDTDNLAYVLYTSGSTGGPKGSMNTHGGLLNRLLWMQERYQLKEEDRVLQKTPICFDISLWEFLWPLIVGAELVMAKPGGHLDAEYVGEVVEERKITTLHFVPSALRMFLESNSAERCASVRRVICSGEVLSLELQSRFLGKMSSELHNLYGPTEAAVDATFWACEETPGRQRVPIGKPIANAQIYVLDERMEPTPIGVPGELYIGGMGLARGYLGQAELTAERFIPNPFSIKAGERLYRTGDMARHLPDGNLEFLGRVDDQVKIGGHRVEPGEVEEIIQTHPAVQQAAVVVGQERVGLENEQRLIAYVVPRVGEVVNAFDLKRHIRQKLPEAMVPGAVVELRELPLTPSGKVDRKRLPKVESIRSADVENRRPPRTEAERYIAEVWREVLQIADFGVDDNFFDLGGHSLLVASIHSRLSTRFNDREITVVDLFTYPTVATLAQFLEKPVNDASLELAAVERAGRQLQAFAAVKGARHEAK